MNKPKIEEERGAFSLGCRVENNISAKAETVWGLLTDAKDFPTWNSNVTSIQGEIREGERLSMHVPGTDRAFTPKVSGVVPNRQMTWADGFGPLFRGVRTFELRPRQDGSTDFTMEERFSGLLLPLFKRSLPDFGPVFEGWATDLKREAERNTHP
ncbi:MAG TPA: SRPBCC domain-containing protein [Anaerolineales bacterium]|nr:SRPBCC domain-containing protein [Anaerolineales bacterium]